MKVINSSKRSPFTLIGLSIVLLWIAFVAGYVLNIVNIVNNLSTDVEVTIMFIFQCIGLIIAPLGSILGWFV